MKREPHYLNVTRITIHYGEEVCVVKTSQDRSLATTTEYASTGYRFLLRRDTERITSVVRRRWGCSGRDKQEKHDEEMDQAQPHEEYGGFVPPDRVAEWQHT